jgi:hypothetical protein
MRINKVKLSLYLTNHAPTFLTSQLDGSEWLASSSCHFTPREKAPDTHWKGSWVGPGAYLGAVDR